MGQPRDFTRKPLLCPKCTGPDLYMVEVREFFHAQPATAMPLYNASVRQRIICAECGLQVYPVRPEKEKEE